MGRSRDKGRAQYHHGDLRKALLDTALELLDEAGGDPTEVSLRALARRAGVSTAAPYHHFADKNQLLAGIAIEGFSQLAAALDEAVGGRRSPARRLQAMAAAYLRFAVAHPNHYRLMFLPAFSDPEAFADYHRSARASFERLVGAIAAVCPQATPATHHMRALAAWSLSHGLAGLVIDGMVVPGAPLPAIEPMSEQIGTMTVLLAEGRSSS